MKRVLMLTVLAVAALQAGPLKVATYPVRHPVKTVTMTVKGLFAAVKAVVW